MKKSQTSLIESINQKIPGYTPIWLMRQAGRYLPEYRALRAKHKDFFTLCYTPESARAVTLQPVDRFDLDAAIIFSDILVIPDALGMEVTFAEGEGPRLSPITLSQDLEILSISRIREHLNPVFEAIRLTRETLSREKALIGFAGAPWTIATYMLEGGGNHNFKKSFHWVNENPNGFSYLIDLLTKVIIEHLQCQIEAGADIVQIFDSWAGVLDEENFKRWSIAPTRTIIDALRRTNPGIPVIGFPRGVGHHVMPYIKETGVSVIGLGSDIVPEWAAEVLQPHVTVQGNLDPLILLKGGPPLDESIKRIMEALAQGPFIFNLGHGIIKETPISNVHKMIDLIRKLS